MNAEDFSKSVIAVPPLARDQDLRPCRKNNGRLIRHLEEGGITTLLYGGNANFYNICVSEFVSLLDLILETVSPDTSVIPSVGPDFGKLMDEAVLVRDLDLQTVMLLPMSFAATPAGVATGIRRFSELTGKLVVLYLKEESYLDVVHVQRLVDDGVVAAIKYAIFRNDPKYDPYLKRLLNAVDRSLVISGIGEYPAMVHFRDFGLSAFTSGSASIAPRASMAMLRALQTNDFSMAQKILSHFRQLEGLRDAISPIRVLHDAVSLSGVADMGPILPCLSNLDAAQRPKVEKAAIDLLEVNQRLEFDTLSVD